MSVKSLKIIVGVINFLAIAGIVAAGAVLVNADFNADVEDYTKKVQVEVNMTKPTNEVAHGTKGDQDYFDKVRDRNWATGPLYPRVKDDGSKEPVKPTKIPISSHIDVFKSTVDVIAIVYDKKSALSACRLSAKLGGYTDWFRTGDKVDPTPFGSTKGAAVKDKYSVTNIEGYRVFFAGDVDNKEFYIPLKGLPDDVGPISGVPGEIATGKTGNGGSEKTNPGDNGGTKELDPEVPVVEETPGGDVPAYDDWEKGLPYIYDDDTQERTITDIEQRYLKKYEDKIIEDLKITPYEDEEKGYKGVKVVDVPSGSYLSVRWGLQSGDVILNVNTVPWPGGSMTKAINTLKKHPKLQKAKRFTVQVLRGEKIIPFFLTLEQIKKRR